MTPQAPRVVLDPEGAHHLAFALIRLATAQPGVGWLLRRWLAIFVPMLHGAIFLLPIPLASVRPALSVRVMPSE